jgi:hypothetical protein
MECRVLHGSLGLLTKCNAPRSSTLPDNLNRPAASVIDTVEGAIALQQELRLPNDPRKSQPALPPDKILVQLPEVKPEIVRRPSHLSLLLMFNAYKDRPGSDNLRTAIRQGRS